MASTSILSIVIPAYNEERFIVELLEKIVSIPVQNAGFQSEILVVDDGSKDQTFALAEAFAQKHPSVRVFKQVPNQGKGRAVQRGVKESTGKLILIQDADLEYDPEDYLPMLKAYQENSRADGKVSVYGSRTLGQYRAGRKFPFPGRHPEQGFGPWVAGVLLTFWALLLYGRWITDTLTAYKLYPAQWLRDQKLKTHGFETDHEITAKLARDGYRIQEVPVSYYPRSLEEGKKIRPRDGLIAVWTLLKFRIS